MADTAKLPQKDPLEVIRRAQAGDEEAFRALYFKHSPYIARMVYSIMGSDAELDDLVQETFLGAYRSLSGLRELEKFKAWLGKIAVRTIFKHLRTERKLVTQADEMDNFTAPARPEELRMCLYNALDTLPSKHRVPWILYRHEEMSLAEVAEVCDTSLATVKRHIKRAERALQARLR